MAYQSEIEKLEQRYRENPQQWFAALADSYRKAGSLDLAIDVVKAGLEKRPNYVSGHIVHGRCLIDQQKDGEALAVFERVLQLDAENVIAIKALAEIAERSGQPEAVQRWVGRLLEVDPMNEEAQQMMARLKEAGQVVPATPPAAPDESLTALSAAGALLAAPPEPGDAEPVADAPRASPPADSYGPIPSLEAPAAAMAPEAGLVLERTGEAEFGDQVVETPPGEPKAVSEPTVSDVDRAQAETAGLASAATLASRPPSLPSLPPPTSLDATVAEQPNPVDLSPFDDALAWGTGDRTSRQITATDVERAEHAHEASLDQVVHALPGLERAEVPMTAPHEAPPEGSGAGQPLEIAQELTGAGEAPRYEPIDEGREPSGIGGGSTAGGSRLSGDLPLIYPDEVAPPAEPFTRVPSRVGGAESQVSVFEPEPVVTETMAELYAGQGLVDQARETYRKLLAQRPGDAGLMQRLASLDPAAASAPRRTRVAGVTGGPSVRDFLSDVFAGRPSGEVTPPPPAPLVPADSPEPAPAAEVPIPESETTLLESAFEDSAGPSGEPTRRASDEVSLAAVFGEEPPPPKSAEAGEERHPPGKAFSFDEFFGTQRPSRESSASSADDDDFKRWLKSLKS